MSDKIMQIKEQQLSAANSANTNAKVNYHRAADYRTLAEYIGELAARHSEVETGYIGTTILERPIPVISIGKNKSNRSVLYVGGIHGTDILTPAVLLRFMYDYIEFLENGKRMYNVSLQYLFENRTIHMIPMLNPDGYEIKRCGISISAETKTEVVRERLIKQNGGEDFSEWRGNARGVDLWRNFTECGEAQSDNETVCRTGTPGLYPESEPEVSALCNYLRVFDEISMVLALHSGSDGFRYFTSGGKYTPRSRTIGRLLSRMTGYPLENHQTASEERGGSLTDWFILEQNKPAFECGYLINNDIDRNDPEEYVKIYAAFREAFFSAPLLI